MVIANLLFLAQELENRRGGGGGSIFGSLCACCFWLLFLIPVVTGWWKIFEKAGKPGWAAIVPVYNFIVMLEIIDRPIWWLILLVCAGPIFHIIVSLELAKSYGKGIGFAVGMILVPFIFVPMLGFGDSKYVGSQHVI
jgi:hypothetical protein